jgi:glycerate kinase
MRPVLVAPDSFKGTIPAARVAAAIVRGLQEAGAPAQALPVADGGEGTLEVLLGDGELVTATVEDPLGREIEAQFAMIGDTAVVEMARASGLQLLEPHERDAERASSAGTGQLIAAAAAHGAREIVVAAGGSATTDGGAGALAHIDTDVPLTVLCDVRTPFEQAAQRFAPQKGADAAAVGRLQRRLAKLAQQLPRDPRGVQGGGAAGGLAGGLWAARNARLVPGAPYVLDRLDFDVRMRAARAVVVGEGRIDRSTLEGKVAGEIAVRARQAGVPAHAIVGEDAIDRFDARILDLQLILEAGDERALQRAGRKLVTAL